MAQRFVRRNLTIKVCKLDGPGAKGYSGVALARACDRAEQGIVALRRAATPPLPALSWAQSVRARAEAQTCR